MYVSEIENVLLDLYLDKNNYKTILIDGLWGCGKTFQVDKFVSLVSLKHQKRKCNKELEKRNLKLEKEHDEEDKYPLDLTEKINKSKIKKVIYVSLYGANNIEDIEHKIVKITKKSKLSKFKNAFKVGGEIVSSLSAYQNSIGKIVDPIKNTLKENDDGERSKLKKGTMIIFDDLERVNYNNFSFVDLMGYINSLVSCGVKVVCVCAEEIIKKHLEIDTYYSPLQDYEDFKEKTFDKIYSVSLTNVEIVRDILSPTRIERRDASDLLKVAHNNLRVIKNTVDLLNSIDQTLREESNGESTFNTKDYMWIVAATMTIRCVYDIHGEQDLNRLRNENKPDIQIATNYAKKCEFIVEFDDLTQKKINDFLTYFALENNTFCYPFDKIQNLFAAMYYFYINNGNPSLINGYIEMVNQVETP